MSYDPSVARNFSGVTVFSLGSGDEEAPSNLERKTGNVNRWGNGIRKKIESRGRREGKKRGGKLEGVGKREGDSP